MLGFCCPVVLLVIVLLYCLLDCGVSCLVLVVLRLIICVIVCRLVLLLFTCLMCCSYLMLFALHIGVWFWFAFLDEVVTLWRWGLFVFEIPVDLV